MALYDVVGRFVRRGLPLRLEIWSAFVERYNGPQCPSPKRYPHRRFVRAVWVFCAIPWYLPLYAAVFVTGAFRHVSQDRS